MPKDFCDDFLNLTVEDIFNHCWYSFSVGAENVVVLPVPESGCQGGAAYAIYMHSVRNSH